MAKRIGWGVGLALVAIVMVVGGCAGRETSSAPLPAAKALQPADLAGLAGEWRGTLRGTGTTGPAAAGRTANLRVTIAPDGSFTSNIDGVPGVGRGRIEGGRILFEGSTARGSAALHEGEGRRVLVGEGTWVGFAGSGSFQVTKR